MEVGDLVMVTSLESHVEQEGLIKIGGMYRIRREYSKGTFDICLESEYVVYDRQLRLVGFKDYYKKIV